MPHPRARAISRTLAAVAILTGPPAIAASADADSWISLFDGKSLSGWKASEHPDSIHVVDGTIACDGPRAHLFYIGPDGAADFENFEFTAEVLTRPGANSGIYFNAAWQDSGWPNNAGFEAQVNNTQPAFDGGYVEKKLTGSLYGVRNVYKSIVRDNEWFTMKIVVRRPTIQIRVNGVLLVDYVEPANAAAVTSDDFAFQRIDHGTFALQCHDGKSKVFFRNLRVRRLPPGVRTDVLQPTWTAQDIQRWKLGHENFPIVDLQTVLAPGRGVDELLNRWQQTGIFPGVVANLGRHAPVHDAASATAFLDAVHGRPVLVGLQCSENDARRDYPAAILSRFDYLLGDMAMGADAAVAHVDSAAITQFLADRAVHLIESQPIDVCANPTWLPASLAARADTAWSESDLQRIIDAAVRHGVAFEISATTHLPSAGFVRLAKQAGARFAIGTGDLHGADPDDWFYPLAVQQQVGLDWKDMYVPGHAPTRAQR